MNKKSGQGWETGLVIGLSLLGGGLIFVYFYKPEWFGGLIAPRLSESGEPMPRQVPNPINIFLKVRNRSAADGVSPELQAALDEWERSGPFPITIGSGVRTDVKQAELYAYNRIDPTLPPGTGPGQADGPSNKKDPNESYATNARTTRSTAHGVRSGYGRAFDFDPVPATLQNYITAGEWFEARGFEWGGRWKTAFPPKLGAAPGTAAAYGGDIRHVNQKNWQTIPV